MITERMEMTNDDEFGDVFRVQASECKAPPEWFWKDHRIPMQLRNIEEGYVALDYYIMAWLIYVIPNFWDVVRYYGR